MAGGAALPAGRTGVATETDPETKVKRLARTGVNSSNSYLALLLFVGVLAYYFMSVSGHHYSIDGIAYYQQTKPLLFEGTFKFDPPLVWGTASFSYTYWSEGLSLAYIPLLALFAYLVFPGDASFRLIPATEATLQNDAGYRYVSLANPIFTAITVSFIFLIAVKFGFSQKRAALVAAVYGLASPAAGYHKEDFAQPLATMCQVLAIYTVLGAFQASKPGGRYLNLALAGFFLGLLILSRGEAVVVFLPFIALLVLWEYRKLNPGQLLVTGAAFAGLLIPLVLFHFWVNYLKSGTLMGVQATQLNSLTDIATLLKNLIGQLFSPGRGLAVFFPLVLYVPYGLYLLDRAGNRKWAVMFGSLFLVNIIFYSYWPVWWGGVSWGPRFFIPLLPLFTLVAFWPARPRRFLIGFKQTTLYPLLKLAIIAGGLITSLGGTLLHWYRFETTAIPFNPNDPGAVYFQLESNLIWMRWQSFSDWRAFDLYTLNHLYDGQSWRWLGILILGSVFLLASGLITYLVTPRPKYW